MKKTSNKGFSLVELIVVIAIMGVLMVVLAPQYLKYVEKSRLQKDNSAIAEVAENIKIAVADEQIAKSIPDKGKKVELVGGTVKTWGSDDLEKELASVLGNDVNLTSNTYKGKKVELIVIQESGVYVVYGNGLLYTPGATTASNSVKY